MLTQQVNESAAGPGEPVPGQNPHCFLVGFPCSGLTLLQRILDAHADLAIAPKVDWVTDYYQTRTGLSLEGPMAPELVFKWAEQGRFDAFGIDREQIKRLVRPGELLPWPGFLARLFGLYAKVRGKPLVGCTTPEHVRFPPALHRLWPGARVVHLIRDGRDVCLALLDRHDAARATTQFPTWEEDPVSTIAFWWKRRTRQGREARASLGAGCYYELRYEELVHRPAEAVAGLCAFLDLPYDPAMLRFHEGQTPAGADARTARLPITPGLPDWHAQMPPAQLERFEAAAGDLLDELGYLRGTAEPSPEVRQRAARLWEAFAHPDPGAGKSPRGLARRRREAAKTNPFVFIVGCPRSGTTLLQRILDAHPDVAVCPETFWVPYFFKERIGVTPEGLMTPQLIPRLLEYYKFHRMKVGRDELEQLLRPGEATSYAEFVGRIFDCYGDSRGKPLVGDKTPDYVRNLPTLHQLWPEAKCVHLIRDGREVCLSAINWKRKAGRFATLYSTWAEDAVGTAALWWEWHVRHGRQGGGAMAPGAYYELRYEELVHRPAEAVPGLCAFLGLPYDPAMLRFHEGRTQNEPGRDAKAAWLPITPGLRDWRTQMPPEQLERFEAAAGDLLDELGYARAYPRPRPEVQDSLTPSLEAFNRDIRSLGDWLP
jgi:hypothetical protein